MAGSKGALCGAVGGGTLLTAARGQVGKAQADHGPGLQIPRQRQPRKMLSAAATGTLRRRSFSLLLACLKVILPPVHPYSVVSFLAVRDNQEHTPSHDVHSTTLCSEGTNPVLTQGPLPPVRLVGRQGSLSQISATHPKKGRAFRVVTWTAATD